MIYGFRYSGELFDRTDPECDCKDDCELAHIFTSLEKQEYDDQNSVSKHKQWFDKGDETRPPSGMLANYLLDPADVFSNRLIKNLTKLSYHLQQDIDLAQKRFDEVSFVSLKNEMYVPTILTFDSLEGHSNPEHLL